MDGAKKLRASTNDGCHRLNGSLLNGGQQRRSVQNEELKQLEDEIKKAYMLKTLHAQLAEKEANRMAEEIQTRIVDEIERCQTDIEIEERIRIEQSERQQRINELQAVLKRQVDKKYEERCLVEEEERRERAILTELDRVREEQEAREKTIKKEQLAEQLLLENLIQKEIREIDKQKLEELEDEESAKNQKYIEELEERSKRVKKLRLDAQKKREEVILVVAKMLLELQEEKTKRQRLLADLLIEEVKFDADLEAREADLRRRQKMLDYAKELEEQIRFEEECRRRFLEREREFAETILVKIMESEKMERLTVEVRRRRKLEYRKELHELLKERDRARTEELDRLRLALEEERRKEEADREEARRARMQLLESHIDHIADFMSKKSLYDEEREILEESRKQK